MSELMRVSDKNYYKNFKDGIHENFTKLKPMSIIKGSTLIELFDAKTGDKISEQYSENLITNALNKYLYQSVIEMLVQVAPTVSLSQIASLFGNIVLTDYTGAEDAALGKMAGVIIGWASKSTTYAGADTKRGTVNVATTTCITPTSMSFVFDWPTTAGNGTFRTLWWIPALNAPTTSPYAYIMFGATSIATSQTVAFSQVCFAKNDYYSIRNDNLVYKNARNPASAGTTMFTAGVLAKNPTGDDSAPKGITWDGTYFWIYGSTSGKFFKYDYAFNLQTSWACAAATYIGNWNLFCWHVDSIYTIRRVNATTWNLYKFNTAGVLQNTYNIYGVYTNFLDADMSSAYLSVVSDGISLYLSNTAATTVKFLQVTGAGVYVTDFLCENGIASSGVTAMDEYGFFYITANSSTLLYAKCPAWSPITQNLLGVPTTKTSANTMKITYNFTLDITGV